MAYAQSTPVPVGTQESGGVTEPEASAQSVESPTLTQPLAKAAQEQGVIRCLGVLEQLGNDLIGDNAFGANINIDDGHPDDRPVQAVLSIATQSSPTAIAIIDAAPVDNGCAPAFTLIRAWPRDCLEISKTLFNNFEYQGQMPGGVTRLTLGERLQALLMPLPSGCLSIRIEVAQ